MPSQFLKRKIIRRSFAWLRRASQWLVAQLTFFLLWLVRLLPPDPAINATEKLGRFFGMRYPRTRLARKNLKLAFPEKSDAEIDATASEMWQSLSRTAAEYAFLDQIFDFDAQNPGKGRFEIAGIEHFEELKSLNGPAICFTAHTANWELLPIAAAAYGLNFTALFRPPNNPYIAERILAARRTAMGHLIPSKVGASWALADILEQGGKVGMLVDQYYNRGVPIEFFGRQTLANQLLAKLARQFDCPVYPARCIRLPGGRFRIELQQKLQIPQDDTGRVDVHALTQKVNDTVETWIREYPGQWLWLHNRWRGTERTKRRLVKNRKSYTEAVRNADNLSDG
jgi:Kdo2-lipid IVA lauroyltransferase/acyltransferase